MREVAWVIVAEAPGLRPVTVSKRLLPVVDVIATLPAETVGVAHVKAASKLVMVTVKPSAVAVGEPKVGFRALPMTVQVADPSLLVLPAASVCFI